jgi:diaminopimelate decarboxylase
MDKIVNAVKKNNLILEDDPSIVIYDTDIIAENVKNLQDAFPDNSLLCFAIKASPLTKLISFLKEKNLGIEVNIDIT